MSVRDAHPAKWSSSCLDAIRTGPAPTFTYQHGALITAWPRSYGRATGRARPSPADRRASCGPEVRCRGDVVAGLKGWVSGSCRADVGRSSAGRTYRSTSHPGSSNLKTFRSKSAYLLCLDMDLIPACPPFGSVHRCAKGANPYFVKDRTSGDSLDTPPMSGSKTHEFQPRGGGDDLAHR
jgi:hypothetical protein